MRRLVARFIDLLIALVLILTFSSVLLPRLSRESPILLWILAGALWIAVESSLLAKWSTTPGKWLLRTRVEPRSVGPIPLSAALDRSFTVFCWGLGCMLPGLSLFTIAIAYQDLKNAGTTRWDRGRFHVGHEPIGPGRVVLVGLVLLVLFVLAVIISTYTMIG